MRSGSIFTIIILMLFLFFSGCSNRSSQPLQEPDSLNSKPAKYHTFSLDKFEPVDTSGMMKKIENFAIIFDPSASMTETYEASDDCISCHTAYKNSDFAQTHAQKHGGREFAPTGEEMPPMRCNECHQDYLYNKFDFAKQLVNGFNQTIPDLKYTGIFRTFGYPVHSRLTVGPDAYDRKEFSRTIEKIFDADGASPLSPTLENVGKDMFKLTGKKAVIIISDGKDMGPKEVVASKDLKARYGDDICIYTIHIGNDPEGKEIMDKIASAGKCGLSVIGDTLLAKQPMDELVTDIFLTKDTDNDGVPDFRDDCPGTEPGLPVDENGCWKLIVLGNLLFDFDKTDIKPEGIRLLDKVVALLNKHDFLNLHISGHTDNYGSMDYNIDLSKRRATAGLNYIKKKGVSPQRLSITWHSYSQPAATNETDSGRALNRRLE